MRVTAIIAIMQFGDVRVLKNCILIFTMEQFTWTRKGIIGSEIVVSHVNKGSVAKYVRKNSLFSHKTHVAWGEHEYIMNYDGSFRDNVIVENLDGMEVARYDAAMFLEVGKIVVAEDGKTYSYRRKEHMLSYKFEVLDKQTLLGHLEITKQTGTRSEGTLELIEDWETLNPVIPALFVHLAVHN